MNGCPCLFTTPCKRTCTCANGVQSGGCQRCARYGNAEQRKVAALSLVEQERKAAALDWLETNRIYISSPGENDPWWLVEVASKAYVTANLLDAIEAARQAEKKHQS